MDASGVAAVERTPDELAGRLFAASLGMFDVMAVYLGDQLGLYRALRDGGAATSSELAGRAGIDERYAREWLEQQAATGILEWATSTPRPTIVGSASRRRTWSRSSTGPARGRSARSAAPSSRAPRCSHSCSTAFKTGGGVPWADYGADMIESQGDFNRPWLVNSFGSEILPAIPDIHRSPAGGSTGPCRGCRCGVGWAAIAIATAYPAVRVDGYDLDESSIELARRNAEAAGVADRVTFEARDIGAVADGTYDVVVIIEAVHDMSRPAEVLASVRRVLRPGGVALSPTRRPPTGSPRPPTTRSARTTGSASSPACRRR